MRLTIFETRQAWLDDHANYFSSSEAAALLGKATWRGLYAVVAAKRRLRAGLAPQDEENLPDRVRWGELIEPVVAQLFVEKTGRAVRRLGKYAVIRSERAPHIGATPDYEILDNGDGSGPGILEVKSVDYGVWREQWEPEGRGINTDASDAIPVHYALQVQHQLAASDGHYRWAMLAAQIGREQKLYRIERDEVIGQALIAAAEEAWQRYIEGNETPPGDGTPESLAELKATYPRDDGSMVDLTPEDEAALWERVQLAKQRAEIEAREDELKGQLLAAFGQARYGRLPSGGIAECRTIETKERTVHYPASQYRRIFPPKTRGERT